MPNTSLSRRAALLAPLGLAACETIDSIFNTKKDPLPGKREPLRELRRGFNAEPNPPAVSLPAPNRNADWAQPGGNPAHLMGHLGLAPQIKRLWSVDLGHGGGYRAKILAQPVVAGGAVFAMDSEAAVTSVDLAAGKVRWHVETLPKDTKSTNIGGGLCWAEGTLYAVNGVSELLALDPANGAVRWRVSLDIPARSAPTVVDGRIFLTTIEGQLRALSAADGHTLWTYQATETATTLLGGPAVAVSNGIVVAGFGSGEVAALRAETGTVVWTDGLGQARGRATMVDFRDIRGAPVIVNGQVIISGMGGITIAADLLTGRRVWERALASPNTLYAAGDWMFVLSNDQEAGAINLDDARIGWVSTLPRWENVEKKKDVITWYGPILAGNRLIVVGSNKEALSLDPLTGTIIGNQTLSDAPAPFTPVVANGTLLLVTDDGQLTAWT